MTQQEILETVGVFITGALLQPVGKWVYQKLSGNIQKIADTETIDSKFTDSANNTVAMLSRELDSYRRDSEKSSNEIKKLKKDVKELQELVRSLTLQNISLAQLSGHAMSIKTDDVQ